MLSKATTGGTAAVPSRNALRVLRNLAVAGSTLGTVCATAAFTYDTQRRIRYAEKLVENKRTLQTSSVKYDATAAAERLSRMMDQAKAGEFDGFDAFNYQEREARKKKDSGTKDAGERPRERKVAPSNQPARADVQPKSRGGRDADDLLKWHFTSSSSGPASVDAEQRRAVEKTRKVADKSASSVTDANPASQDYTISPPEEIRDLLEQNQAIDATQLLLSITADAQTGISSELKKLATRAFYQNCKQQNVFVAKNLFVRLDSASRVTDDMWSTLVFALAKRGSVETAATVYLEYKDRFSLPPILLDVVIRCLVEAHRLSAAKELLYKSLPYDRSCGLCGAYLAGIWRKTRSMELLNGQVKGLLKQLSRIDKSPTDKLFNPVIKAYVEFGRHADAEALVDDMVNKFNIPLRCRTKGLLVFGRALKCDWDGVSRGLDEMHEAGMVCKAKTDFIQIFDRIFLEYWVSHTGPEVRDFIFYWIEKFNFYPDRVLYKHILEAFVEKGDVEMVSQLTELSRQKSWKIEFDEKEFVDLLRSRRMAMEESPVGFWRMLKTARVKYGQAAASQQILGYDARSFPVTDVNKLPFTGSSLPWYERKMKNKPSTRHVDQYIRLEKQMAFYMQVGKFSEALTCFEAANARGYHNREIHLELGLIATLLEHGIVAAQRFLKNHLEDVRKTFKRRPEYMDKIAEADSAAEWELVKAAIFRFYELNLNLRDPKVKHQITVAASHRLIAAGKTDRALNLLSSVYTSRYRKLTEFPAVCMKMFARAFASLSNVQGIRWCILTGLSRDSAVNREFIAEIQMILAGLKRGPGPHAPLKLEYLEYIANMLERKDQGDADVRQLRSEDQVIQAARARGRKPMSEQSLFRVESIESTVESWDEEYELQAALGRSDAPSTAKVAELSEEDFTQQRLALRMRYDALAGL